MTPPKYWLRLLAFALVLLPGASVAQDLPRVPPGPAGTVTISRPDYDQLIDLASRRPRVPDAPPLAAALTRADIRVRISGSIVRATMQVDGEVFVAGLAKVPLITGATLLEARMADRPLPLVAEGNTHVAVVSGPSTFTATLEWGAAITTTPGRGSFAMPVPQSGSAVVTIELPGEQTDVRITPGLVLRRTSANGQTTIEATLDPGSVTQVSWSSRETAPSTTPREARLLADVKTLVTIGDADLRLVTLVNVVVVQGEPTEIEIRIPPAYEVSGVTGATLDRSEERPGAVVLFVADPAQRRHQFLLSLERSNTSGSAKLETGFPTLPSAQRETGEVAVEGIGTLAVLASDLPGLRRIDVREIDPALASAARQPLLAAFRYRHGPGSARILALDVTRFADAAVLAAVAERAVATTLVTSEGRALTEVSLWVRNRAQPFIKVELPAGASMLSVEVAGEAAKPAEGKDGIRVPLLRPGFRSDGPYAVSFVYLHAGAPFDKKGTRQMTLPKMDLPISVVEWELFVPDRYRVDRFGGNSIPAHLVEYSLRPIRVTSEDAGAGTGIGTGVGGSAYRPGGDKILQPGQIMGSVVDSTGAALPGVTVTAQGAGATQTATTDERGAFVLSALSSGPITLVAELEGFAASRQSLVFDQRPRQADFVLASGALSEVVTVVGESPRTKLRSTEQRDAGVSLNVQSLQRRAAGILPVRIEVPRAGTSHRFVKPLVIDEETMVSFRYRRR